ncbi:hypothetical protein K2Z83_26880 [Oscillochloris sp. ZM17-4]|uniref:hypothetical protein n=1 Tax=Oscillochloris sp. ZM17-4 TaxID=2866714 RepID=UPI001C73167A|nr:hypothetical protein [Oscillochloris sp. ZM17-4]MBX0331279.1 hypothetical protein [Oscillochloris sp. ZM17-4]
MATILTVDVTIQGIRPLLWHSFGPETIPVSGKRERTGVAGNDPDEWRRTVLVTPEGQLYLPASAVFGCLRDGARFTRKGRGSIQPALVATLQIVDEHVVINRFLPEPLPTDVQSPVFLHISSVKNPATKARNVRYRVAASAGWQTRFTLQVDPTVISRGELEAVVIDAGRLVGIGNGRQIGMGRFEVRSFAVRER